ncbi:universal stress protein [Marinobacterium sp. YM272]|uniref:universal stress protein n=1 Tax=Marinobacterium sp. YM272 TaxID=3421654 RepID=UPI003D7FC8DB
MYTNILIPMDPDHADLFPAQVEAAEKLLSSGGRISVLYVNPNYTHSLMAATTPDKPTEVEQAVLDQVIERFETCVSEALRGQVYSQRGVVHDQVLRVAGRIQADLIIMAACKKPLERYFLGSNTRKVTADAKCAVLVQR